MINLSPDKPQVFKEAYRVLKAGGRLAVSDIVTTTELPGEIKSDLGSLYSGAFQEHLLLTNWNPCYNKVDLHK